VVYDVENLEDAKAHLARHGFEIQYEAHGRLDVHNRSSYGPTAPTACW
jgi:hypothetical protein